MRVLIVGNGGREHTLLWKLRLDQPGGEFFVTQPNGGMAGQAQAVPISPTDVEALAGWAQSQRIDLAVIGPEAPLAMGLVDRLAKGGVPAFGPSRGAARIESSKAFAKELMERSGVPTAGYEAFRDPAAAAEYLDQVGAPIVVKASGLAAGKGAVVCQTREEAQEALDRMMGDLAFGEAGREVVIEEFMQGEELSLFALADGTDALPLLPSQDHKRVGEGDTGPNTGGMGAYAPVGPGTDALVDRAMDEVLLPTLHGLRKEETPFRGLLYAGLMLTDDGPKVVEFNARFGDPETQVVLPLMEGPLLPLLELVAQGGSVRNERVTWRQQAAVTTVVASGGYPGTYDKGHPITVPDDLERDDRLVFHAGTALDGDQLVTSGGRVLAVTGLGDTLQDAAVLSKEGAALVEFEGRQFRSDIGWREFARSEADRP